MMGIFLGDRSVEDDEGNEMAGPQYCGDALTDVALYRLVQIGHYDEEQINDPNRVSAQFAMRLLRAHAADKRAESEDRRRKAPRN